jgi:hypothetical protein
MGADFWIVIENSLLTLFVAAATFIGSMSNTPPGNGLEHQGILFACMRASYSQRKSCVTLLILSRGFCAFVLN